MWRLRRSIRESLPRPQVVDLPSLWSPIAPGTPAHSATAVIVIPFTAKGQLPDKTPAQSAAAYFTLKEPQGKVMSIVACPLLVASQACPRSSI